MKRLNIFLMLVFMACSCWINSVSAHPDADANPTDIVGFPRSKLGWQIALTTPGVDSPENITVAHVRSLTVLEIGVRDHGTVVGSLERLEHATSLESLTLISQEITGDDALAPLAGLTTLTTLDLTSSLSVVAGVSTDISHLSSLTNLTVLKLESWSIEDIGPLEDLTNLRNLDLSNNNITDVSPLEDLTGLVTLDLSGNTNLTNLGALYKLKQGGTTIVLPVGLTIPASVIFENEALEAAVKSELGIGPDEPILPTNLAENLTALTATGKEIDDLRGLEGATALTTLDLGQNAIASVDPLGPLANLETLDLADNQIQQIRAITNLPALETLDLRNNSLMSLEYLENAPELETLYLDGNADLINDLTEPAQLDNARLLVKLKTVRGITIDLTLPSPVTFRDENLAAALRPPLSLEDDDPIFPEDMELLTDFRASNPTSGKEIVNLTGLETAINLAFLTLNGHEIASLTPLANLTSLTELNLADNTISSLTDLSGLINLTTLNLSNNQITDVSPLRDLTGLVNLDLSGNTNLTNLGALYKLKQGGTTIVLPVGLTIPASVIFENEALEAAVKSELEIGPDEPILPTNLAENLTALTATGKGIDNLTGLEGATALTTLDLGQNAIVSIDLLGPLANLETLDLADNQIQWVNAISTLPVLETLDLRNNSLRSLDYLEDLPALQTLSLNGNAGLIDDLTDPDQMNNARRLVKLTVKGITIDLTLPSPVTFPDENLAAALRSGNDLGFLADDDPIFPEDMELLMDFIVSNPTSGKEIVNLTGLETAINLTILTLNGHEIASLTPLVNLTSLTELNLADNTISSLTDLSGLINLTTLDLSNNQITDVSPLRDLTGLDTLDLSGNTNLTNLGALYKLKQGGTKIVLPGGFEILESVTFENDALEAAVKSELGIGPDASILETDLAENLTRLIATGKEIDDLTGLEGATALTTLDLGQNAIADFGPLSNLTNLETLDLADNAIVNLPPNLSGLTRLVTLNLADNNIQDVSGLPNVSTLETLDLRNNVVGDVTPLSTMTSLKRLYLRGNANLQNVKLLVKLKEAGTTIDIPLPRPVTFRDDNLVAALRTALSLEDNDLIFPGDMEGLLTLTASSGSIVNLTGLETATALTTLDLNDNQIVSLSPLARLESLTTLNLSSNSISSISSLSRLTNLTSLELQKNQISSISSLSRLTNLDVLNLSDNRITSVSSLSDLTSLTGLLLSNNRITDVLPLQGLINLNHLDLLDNENLTMEKVSVLYTLKQANPDITIDLPAGIGLPDMTNIVRFENLDLAAAVRSALRITKGYPILTTGEKGLDTLERLTATRKQIDNLTGLEGATALTTLDLGQNAITDFGPLASLPNLETLDLADNAIENLPPNLSGLTSLVTLDLGQNNIVTLTPLSGLTALVTLDLADNNIEGVSSLSGLSALKTLDLRDNSRSDDRDNNVTDVTPLSGLTLKTLYLRGNDNLISDLTQSEQLANARALVKLKFGDTRTTIDLTLPRAVTFRDEILAAALRTADPLNLEDDDPIFPADMARLTQLTVVGTQTSKIANLTGLETAINLTGLTLNGNEIASLTPLARLEALETLNLADNEKISSISSLARLAALTNLNLSNNKISSVSSLSRLEALQTLNLADNTISSLTALSGLINLTALNLSNNRITDVLPLQGLSTLRTLNLSGNENLTMEKASVLYTLQQANPSIVITLPTGIDLLDPADIVIFSNPDLATAVRSTLRITKGYPILKGPIADKKDITDLTRLTATRKNISDLTGLEEATGLTTLDLGQNDIENLGPLASLPNLETLDLADNAIVNLPPNLSGLTSLVTLDLGQNNIVTLTPLSEVPSLVTLDLADNNIEGVSSLSGLSALKTLDLRDNSRSDDRDNDVTDVTPLSGLTLKTLYLRGNDNLIDDLTVAEQLANARALVKLKFGDTRTTIDITLPRAVTFRDENLATALRTADPLNLEDDDPIFPADMARLTQLTVVGTQTSKIANLTGLETAINLTGLTLNGNEIASLTPLARLEALETLNLADNENISSISSLARLTALTDLNLSNNKVSSVSSLSRLEALETLNLADNSISSLTVLSGLINLTTLNLSNNRITDVLPLQGLSALRTLNLSGNENLTMEKASVLYTLQQANPSIVITLPDGVDLLNPDDIVSFNNPDLAAAVRIALRITKGYPILEGPLPDKKDITDLTRLTATRKGIVDLTGLGGATNLTTLDLGDNLIVDLQPLQGLTNLTTLDLADNQIADFGPLAGLSNLKSLDLDGNLIMNLPSVLTGLSSIEMLDLRDNDVRDVTPLSRLTTLKYLYVRGNENLENMNRLANLGTTRVDIPLPDAVAIPDTNLAAALRTQLGLEEDDPISPGDMEGLTTFDGSNQRIEDLTGLETATGLTSLTLSNNAIVDLEPLEDLTSLTDLNLSRNQIVDVSPLEALTSLTFLNLQNNQIIDVAPLAELTNLTSLLLRGNDNIINLGALYHLADTHGGPTNIDVPVPGAVTIPDDALAAAVRAALRIAPGDPILPDAMARLTRLTASRKGITSLEGLEEAGFLETLDVGQNNEISDLAPLSGLTKLKVLDLADNKITAISALEGLTTLQTLDLRNNNVTDTARLSKMTHLKNLYVRGNANLDSPKQLVKLTAAGTRVDITLPRPVTFRDENLAAALQTTLDALPDLALQPGDPIFPEDMAMLTTFTASGQSIVNLTGLETAINLTSLTLNGNEIASLTPLVRLVKLQTLNLANNENISSISSLVRLTALTDLNLSNNKISSVSSLSRLTSLTDLNLSDNRITSVSSLSGLTSLTDLNLSNNSIRDVLPLAVLSSLETLNLDGNTGITNAVVLYRLRPKARITGVTVPDPSTVVAFTNAALEAAVRTALRIPRGHPILPTGEKGLDTLPRLTATRKGIDNLTGLEGATALTYLDLGDNAIVNLSPIADLSSLTHLDVAGNEIATLGSPRFLTNLVNLDLGQNAIVTFPTLLDTDLPKLVTLDLADNKIADVSELSNLSVLETLDLRNNVVGDVTPLSTMESLKRLYLRGNMNLTNVKLLVKLKETSRTSIDITLPRPVTFRDEYLAARLREALNSLSTLTLQDDDLIFPEDMEMLTTFTASGAEIVNLTGLETATGLATLNLSDNQIVSLSPLARLMNLKTLNLSSNSISSLSSLSRLTGLTTLNLNMNRISSVSSLSKLEALEELNLADNSISSLTALVGLSSLTALDLSDNRITDVLPLQGLSTLRTLNLSGNENLTMEKASVLYTLLQGSPPTTITLPDGIARPVLADIVRFEDLNLAAAVRTALRITKGYPILKGPIADQKDITDLTRLTITHRRIASLTGLEEATALANLDVGNNQISDLTPLQNLTSLRWLDLADNLITDVQLLSGLTSLERLDLRNNQITDVTPLTGLTSLTRLYLRGNANLTNVKLLVKLENTLVDIPLPDPVEIPDTNLADALRTVLPSVSNGDPIFPEDMEGLTTFDGSGQSIEDLTGLETATGLTELTLSTNTIVDLEPLEDLTSLERLILNNNEIVDVSPLQELTSLTTLELRNNQIEDVAPLAALTNLTSLQLAGNSVTNPGALYHLNQQTTTTITGITVPAEVTITDDALRAAVKRTLRIADADPILPDAMATLTRLTASRKGITSLSGLETAGLLERLDVGQNEEISVLTPLSGLTRLTHLDVADNKITDVSALSGLTNLTTLDLRNNQITDVEPLKGLTSLRQIYIRGNVITNLAWLGAIENLRSDVRLPSVVDIPDTNLDREVRAALSVTGTLPMSEELLESLETLTASIRA